jgi:glycosyltransferase involved in cell wall biosynthesis
MRLLYVVRLFSGLEAGLREGVWRPQGVPTIYRMIEALDCSEHDVRFVFTCKDEGSGWEHRNNRTFEVKGLRRPVTVLAGGNRLPRVLGRARGYLREARQAWPIWRLQREFRPDVMYFDRVNIYQAALAAKFSGTPVVWRVMGVPPAMHAVLEAKDPVAKVTRLAYRAPFALVICSQDGSGGEHWMERALAPDTPRVMMINGADPESSSDLSPQLEAALPDDCTKVLFVARLVDDKGCMAFIDGFLQALAQQPDGLHAVIAGDGPYGAPMRAAVAAHGAGDHVSFLGQVPHGQVAALHKRCDVYVSLNPMGNLTNANLEALRCGACMVIPASQPDLGIDADTDTLIPDDVAMRVRSSKDRDGLADAILRLHRDPAMRVARAARAREIGRSILPSWDERIGREIAMLEELAISTRH